MLASVLRYRVPVIAVTLLAGLAGYFLSAQQSPTYRASAQLFLTNPRQASVFTEGQPPIDVIEYVSQQLLLLRSRTVQERASGLLAGRLSPGEVNRSVEAEAVGAGSLVVDVRATDETPDGAGEIVDAVVQGFSEISSESNLARAQQAVAQLEPQRQDYQRRIGELQQQLAGDPGNIVVQSQIEALNDQLLELESRAQALLVNASAVGDGLDVAEPAIAGDDPVSPIPLRNAAVFAFLGAAFAGAIAYWRAGRPRETAGRDDPARILNAPLLGEIPPNRDPVRETLSGQLAMDRSITESYQFVFASIEYALEEVGAMSVVVTSASAGEGKTTTALQLAMAAGRDGRRVVLVDADIRGQGLTQMLGVVDRTGLTDLALEDREVDDSVHYLPVTDELLLPIVSAGRAVPDPNSFFRMPGFRKAMQRITDEAELVVADSSPLLAVADTSIVGGQVGGIILVVDRETRLAELEALRERLSFVGTPLLGYVYNRSNSPALASRDYGYGQAEARKGSSTPAPGIVQGTRGRRASRGRDVPRSRWDGTTTTR